MCRTSTLRGNGRCECSRSNGLRRSMTMWRPRLEVSSAAPTGVRKSKVPLLYSRPAGNWSPDPSGRPPTSRKLTSCITRLASREEVNDTVDTVRLSGVSPTTMAVEADRAPEHRLTDPVHLRDERGYRSGIVVRGGFGQSRWVSCQLVGRTMSQALLSGAWTGRGRWRGSIRMCQSVTVGRLRCSHRW